MINYLNNKIVIPVMDLLKQGVTPEMLALSIALGFTIGIIPLMGVSTAICAILAISLRLNIVAIQLVNYIAYPLQLLLYIPFIKAGEKIFSFTSSDFTISEIVKLFHEGFIQAVQVLWIANLQGIFVWVMIAAPFSITLYFIFVIIFRKFTPVEITE